MEHSSNMQDTNHEKILKNIFKIRNVSFLFLSDTKFEIKTFTYRLLLHRYRFKLSPFHYKAIGVCNHVTIDQTRTRRLHSNWNNRP